jgi:hypothetical protein
MRKISVGMATEVSRRTGGRYHDRCAREPRTGFAVLLAIGASVTPARAIVGTWTGPGTEWTGFCQSRGLRVSGGGADQIRDPAAGQPGSAEQDRLSAHAPSRTTSAPCAGSMPISVSVSTAVHGFGQCSAWTACRTPVGVVTVITGPMCALVLSLGLLSHLRAKAQILGVRPRAEISSLRARACCWSISTDLRCSRQLHLKLRTYCCTPPTDAMCQEETLQPSRGRTKSQRPRGAYSITLRARASYKMVH